MRGQQDAGTERPAALTARQPAQLAQPASASATGVIAARAKALRHIATASAGATMAAISGPEVETATRPTAISARSARGGRATTPGGGAG